jgi:hypothetical protein
MEGASQESVRRQDLFLRNPEFLTAVSNYVASMEATHTYIIMCLSFTPTSTQYYITHRMMDLSGKDTLRAFDICDARRESLPLLLVL